MNADLYTVLLILSLVGVFLSVVVGKLQFSYDDDLNAEVKERLEAVKRLERDYQAHFEVARSLGALERSEILPMLAAGQDGLLSPGVIIRRALAVYEAAEHVDDPESEPENLKNTMDDLGFFSASDLARADVKAILRLARASIHASAKGDSIETYRRDLVRLIDNGDIFLSDGGQLRLRELLTFFSRADMEEFAQEYRLYSPVIEELLLSASVAGQQTA